jgi:hypothetical protein
MLALALTLAVVASEAAADAPSEANPTQPAQDARSVTPPGAARLLESSSQVRALCEALMPAERLLTRGDVVERASLEAAHNSRREAALGARYQVRIAADRLRFGEYDPDEKQLVLSEKAFLSTAGGSVQVWPAGDAGLPVTADAAAARRIMQAAARKTLALVLTFTLPDDDDVTCGHVNGSNRYSLGVDPFRWEYVDRGQVLARGGEGSDRPIVTAAEGARPRVRVADPIGDGGPELRTAVEAREKDLEGCYLRALRQNPGLDGSLVAEVDLASGAPRSVRMAADSVQDEAMIGCVTGIISHVEFPEGADVLADIPIHFELEPPAAP